MLIKVTRGNLLPGSAKTVETVVADPALAGHDYFPGFLGEDLPESGGDFLAGAGFAVPGRAADPETPFSDTLAVVLVGAGLDGVLPDEAFTAGAVGLAAAFAGAAGGMTGLAG